MTSSKEHIIKIPRLHSGQQKIIDGAKRFNAVNCGRRWGKTIMAMVLLMNAAIEGYPVAWYSPTYKSMSESWKFIKDRLHPLIINKNEQLKELTLVGGGRIDFWSLDDINSSRGRRYKRAIVDEAAFIKNLASAINRTIRPTLTDFKGDLFMFSTPNGKGNDWEDFCNTESDEWQYFEMPTSTNPYISKEELQSVKKELSTADYSQEYDAKFIDISGSEYHHNFDLGHHTGEFGLRKDLPLHISFDFNSKPYMTLQVWQIIYHPTDIPTFRCLKAYSFKKPFNNIESSCEGFLRDFEDVVKETGVYIYGDSSGKNTLPFRDKKNFYEVIRASIKYANRDRIRLLKKNPLHIKRRRYINNVLGEYKLEKNAPNRPPFKVIYHSDHAKDAINDIKAVKVDANNGIWKQKETKNGETYEKVGHHSDASSGIIMYYLIKVYNYKAE